MAWYKTDVTVTYREPGSSDPITVTIDFPPHQVWADNADAAKYDARTEAAKLLKKSVLASPTTDITANAWFHAA